jgi:hypothetical protein
LTSLTRLSLANRMIANHDILEGAANVLDLRTRRHVIPTSG